MSKLDMLIADYEQHYDRKWDDESDEFKMIYIAAWNRALKAINQQLNHLYHNEEEKEWK